MLNFDIDADQLDELSAAYGATDRQVTLASARATRRTAATLRRLSSKGLQSELGLRNAKALRRRMKQFKVGRKGSALKLWYGANDLPLSAFKGRAKKVPGGISFNGTVIHGAFVAKIAGRRAVFKRTTGRQWPVIEAQLTVADRMMIYLEDEVFVDIDAIYWRHFRHEIRAATVLEIGERRA